MVVNWRNLAKDALDPTTIDQAIDAKITNHNDDPEAHLGADQALESHRAAEIIDHLAESVVNDKIASLARAYTAIVDPASESDFDTLEAAVDYVNSLGGGHMGWNRFMTRLVSDSPEWTNATGWYRMRSVYTISSMNLRADASATYNVEAIVYGHN